MVEERENPISSYLLSFSIRVSILNQQNYFFVQPLQNFFSCLHYLRNEFSFSYFLSSLLTFSAIFTQALKKSPIFTNLLFPHYFFKKHFTQVTIQTRSKNHYKLHLKHVNETLYRRNCSKNCT